jgi:prophage maintenance system killer protein
LNFFLDEQDVCLINMHLCRTFGHAQGFSEGGPIRLRAEIDSLAQGDTATFAANFYIAVWRARAFRSLNRATAYGTLLALLPLNGVEIPAGTAIPADVLGPPRWGPKEKSALTDWLRNTIQNREVKHP